MPKRKRPASRVRGIDAVLPDGRTARGYDLNDVVRENLREIQRESDWSESELASQVGVKQSTLYPFLNDATGTRGLSLTTLSVVIAARGTDPLAFFAMHPLYSEGRHGRVHPVDQRDYDALSAAVPSGRQARELARIVQTLTTRGVLQEFLDTQHALLGIRSTRREKAKRPAK